MYQNSGNFEQAVDSFEKARTHWKASGELFQQKEVIDLYFYLSIGGVYESSGNDELALIEYLKALKLKLKYNHPDKAFPFCGLGSVLYSM